MTADPNWLLSSVAQSSAAMVAIVGGLLVSRLITLSSERGAASNRLQESEERRSLIERELADAFSERHATSLKWFVEHHASDVADKRGIADRGSLLNEFSVRGTSEAESEEMAQALLDVTTSAFVDLKAAYPSGEVPRTASEWAERGIEPPEGYSRVYREVAKVVNRERGFFLSTLTYESMVRVTSEIEYQRYDALLAREQNLSADLRAITGEMELIQNRIDSFAQPRGVAPALWSLSYLAVVGIVFPTVLMALRPVPSDDWARAAVVLAFISGLAVLVAYFVREVRTLARYSARSLVDRGAKRDGTKRPLGSNF